MKLYNSPAHLTLFSVEQIFVFSIALDMHF